MNARRYAVRAEASPTTCEPSADRWWASASVASRRPRSCTPVAAVHRKARVQPPKVLQLGSVVERKYFPMITLPSAETPTASTLLPKDAGVDRIWKLGATAASALDATLSSTPARRKTRIA